LLFKRPETGVYQFRKRVPQDLVNVIGKQEIKKSLGTKNPNEAKKLLIQAEAEFNQEMELHRLNMQVPQDERKKAYINLKNHNFIPDGMEDITADFIDDLYADIHHILTNKLNEIVAIDVTPITPLPDFYAGQKIFHNIERETIVEVAYVLKLYQHMYKEAGFKPSEHMIETIKGRMQVSNTSKKELANILKLDTPVDKPTLPESQTARIVDLKPVRHSNAMKLSEALEVWKSKRGGENTTYTEWVRAVKVFNELNNDLPVDLIEDKHIVKFREALNTVPVRLPREYDNTPFHKLIELTKAGEFKDKQPRTASATNKLIAAISSILEVMIEDGVIERNPAKNKKLANNSDYTKRPPYEISELQKLFKSELYQRHFWNNDFALTRPSHFWIPLLGLYTASRLEQLCQLRPSDIRQQKGIWYISFNAEDGNKAKTSHSIRDIPIHDDLIKIGFLSYVKQRLVQGANILLFPDLTRTSMGKLSSSFSNWFSRYTEKVGIKNNNKSFHSFRDNFSDACENAGLSERIINRLMGHTLEGAKKHYGKGASIEVLNDAMKKVKYCGLDLSHLYVMEYLLGKVNS
jgi:integrase